MSKKILLERWEDDEFIITINGKPTGGTVTEVNGKRIVEWLQTAEFDNFMVIEE